MTTHENEAAQADQNGGYFGMSAIFATLVIGGALVAGALMMWQTHNRNVQLAEMSKIEEKARVEIRAAHNEMRARKPDRALERTERANALVNSLNPKLGPDYAPLKIGLLLVEGETLFMKDCVKYAAQAEEKFDQALRLMTFASGEMWQFGMLGRARARIEQEKYEEALSDLDNVMRRNPSYGAGYYWRSLVRDRLGDRAGAGEDEKKARALDSWPPLRDFMQSSSIWTRDIIHKPHDTDPAGTPQTPPGEDPLGLDVFDGPSD